ncbi:MFS transporter [Peribacillus asahii]|uniref:MFS transporter n=1 Tax=Peribacillus asahii TaxID=228899 RepID=UPI00207A6E92|nr:MFS transporter [Peribacillus asahii]USK60938.1 MFS transporter [Peribacillus asahii]
MSATSKVKAKVAIPSTQSELSKGQGGLFHQPIAVWAIFFASITAFMGMGLVNPVLPTIAEKLHATPSEVTLLYTSYNAVMAFAMLITGTLSSRLGHKWTLLLGIIIIAIVSGLGGGIANNIWTLVGLRAGWGLGNALFVATALAAIVSLSNSGTAKAIILYEMAVGLGISVGPLLGGTLGSLSWRAPFLGVATLMVLAFIILSKLMPASNTKTVTKTKTSLLDPFRAMKHRSLLTLGIVAALYNIGFFTIMAYAPFIMGLDPKGLGYVFLGWGILLAITSVFMAPKLQQRFGAIKSMVMMLLLFALTLLIMGIWTAHSVVVIAAVIIAGALLGNNNTLITTAVMDAAPVERSTASAAYSFLRFIGAAISPFMAAKLAEIYNSHVPFLVGAGFVILSVVFILLNYKHIKHIDQAKSAH